MPQIVLNDHSQNRPEQSRMLTFEFMQGLYPGANATSIIHYDLPKLKAQKMRVPAMLIKLEISRGYKFFINLTTQKLYKGLNAMSTIRYNISKLKAQKLWGSSGPFNAINSIKNPTWIRTMKRTEHYFCKQDLQNIHVNIPCKINKNV
jgi:hypothetical protein